MSQLKNKVAIVTGASRGIGKSMAEVFAREGATVIICGRKQNTLDEVAAELKGLAGRVVPTACHVGKLEELQRLVDTTTRDFGKIDILVNNAATNIAQGPAIEMDDGQFDKMVEVNLKSMYRAIRLVAPGMCERGSGSIINIASIAGPLAAPTMPPYSVAKQGVITFTRVVAKELAAHRVTVNAICPGVLYTEFWQKLAQHIADTNPAFKGMTARQVFEKRVTDIVPMKCEQTPEDIGNAAVFLASDEARYITGQALMVDGGCVMW